ncbi:MAG: PilN domain-containing protein [candidate division Zixibacteria bacterium]|nr:PilN domain-containing protein [candidate division Zixibacteria bacterium]
MIEINLLPKEYRHKGRFFSFNKAAVYGLAGAGVAVALIVFATVYQSIQVKSLDRKISDARQRTETLKKDIQLVDALTDVREKLLKRMTAIENLDKYRTVWLRIMEDLSSRVPEYLWLSKFKEEPAGAVASATPAANTTGGTTTPPAVDTLNAGGIAWGSHKATVEGYCYSINSLAAFLINLSRSDYFENFDLKYIKTSEVGKKKLFSFQLGCDVIYQIEAPTFAEANPPAVENPEGEVNQTEGESAGQ